MKLKLDLEELTNDFFCDAHVLGIVAPIKDYQLCWQLNQRFRIDFRLNTEIEIHLNKKGRQYFFSVYEYKHANDSFVHYLYKNHFDGEFLLPELKHLDYLWIIKGEQAGESIVELESQLRSITGVQLVTDVSLDKIKNKANLIF